MPFLWPRSKMRRPFHQDPTILVCKFLAEEEPTPCGTGSNPPHFTPSGTNQIAATSSRTNTRATWARHCAHCCHNLLFTPAPQTHRYEPWWQGGWVHAFQSAITSYPWVLAVVRGYSLELNHQPHQPLFIPPHHRQSR